MTFRKLLLLLTMCLMTIMAMEKSMTQNLLNKATEEEKDQIDTIMNISKCMLCSTNENYFIMIHEEENCIFRCCKKCTNEKYVKKRGLYCLKCAYPLNPKTLENITKQLQGQHVDNVLNYTKNKVIEQKIEIKDKHINAEEEEEEKDCEICFGGKKDLINVHATCNFWFCKDCAKGIYQETQKNNCFYCNRELSTQELNTIFNEINNVHVQAPNNVLNVDHYNNRNAEDREEQIDFSQFRIEAHDGNFNGDNNILNARSDDGNCLHYLLAIPNWIIPGFLTLDKAFIMAILQFGLRIPRDLFQRASMVNILVSLVILIANFILLGCEINMPGEGNEGIMPGQIGLVIAFPIVLDWYRWNRWESEIQESNPHFFYRFTDVQEFMNRRIDCRTVISTGIFLTNYFMPIVLQPTYFKILFSFSFLQWIRLELETGLLLFVANVTARCLAYDANPGNDKIMGIIAPFFLIVYCLAAKLAGQ